MAKVIKQGISPVDNTITRFVPDVEKLQGKMMAELPAVLNAFLALNNFKLEVDSYGNPFIVDEKDSRISIAVAIVNGDEVCTYRRKGNELNLNQGVDVIGAVGYALSSLFYKLPKELWSIKVKKASLARNYAWETTDGDGDKELVKMPIILLELEENPMCSIPILEVQNPTAKMQAVIEELS